MDKLMSKEEFAKFLDGREHDRLLVGEEELIAEAHGLIVVYGVSDDIMHFCGVIQDEADCYGGGYAHLDENGLYQNRCENDDCPYADDEMDDCVSVEAVWNGCKAGQPAWSYKTDIPHAAFDIFKCGILYCRGIVFDMAGLMQTLENKNAA